MEATLTSSHHLAPMLFKTKPLKSPGGHVECNLQVSYPLLNKTYVSVKMSLVGCGSRHSVLLNGPFVSRANKKFSVKSSDQLQSDFVNVEASSVRSLNIEVAPPRPDDGGSILSDVNNYETLQSRPKRFRNRFLSLVRLSSVLNNAAESFFKSEIRRRLFVTAVLLVMSRVGYYIPLPGYDRRLIPQDYLSFASGSVDELGDLTAELKLSLFQLGISPQIVASILMQVLCHVVPSLVKLRKEGLDGHEKIKSYIWWASLGFAILEAIIVGCYSLPYSIYAATFRAKHVMVTAFLLVCGAMTMTWICDTISESGFGQGSSLVICVGILTGYTDTLYKMLAQLSGSAGSWLPYMLAVLGVFTLVTMWAVVVTEGCRKIKLQYYGFKLASAARDDSPITEVEPYIPFNINPSGMQPVLTTTYLLAFPSILAGILGSPFWEHVKEILNPQNSLGADPWVYYAVYAFFVFVFNIFDIANMPKEIADYLNKMGARIPDIKPGKATIEYLTRIQASTRFWGGVMLSFLATTSTILDHYLRRVNEGFAIGILQDMSLEFDSLHTEYKDLEMDLKKSEVKGCFRRNCTSRMREVKQGIRKVEKLMNTISNIETAVQLMIGEIPADSGIPLEVILVLGASPIRPRDVYELSFSHGSSVPCTAPDFTKTRVAEGLSRKAVRALIAKGAGGGAYTGPTKLFLLVKAPSSFSLPLHFLPKRDFKYSKKIVPFRLWFKCKTRDLEVDARSHASQTSSSTSSSSHDLIW
ncbi:SecY domain-containing protein, partial [Cephalotus follicularis]